MLYCFILFLLRVILVSRAFLLWLLLLLLRLRQRLLVLMLVLLAVAVSLVLVLLVAVYVLTVLVAVVVLVELLDVVALWAIPDPATEKLMSRFYEHLVEGESASESLHQAMKWMRKNGLNTMSEWASFTLIGDDVSFEFGAQR